MVRYSYIVRLLHPLSPGFDRRFLRPFSRSRSCSVEGFEGSSQNLDTYRGTNYTITNVLQCEN
jgi:hypothetical protein